MARIQEREELAVSSYAEDVVQALQSAFEPHRDPARATSMSAYMRNLFPFVGIATTERRRLAREALSELPKPAEPDLTAATMALYELPEREYHYVAVELAVANVRTCGPGFLDHTRWMVTTHSWWDTVDGLAADVVGTLVRLNPELATAMDQWVGDENMWVARTAILHQLRYKGATDTERLFGYCVRQAGHKDFFIRKAIGWALREYSKTDPDAVRTFITEHDGVLSGLSKREGMLWIVGRKKKPTRG